MFNYFVLASLVGGSFGTGGNLAILSEILKEVSADHSTNKDTFI